MKNTLPLGPIITNLESISHAYLSCLGLLFSVSEKNALKYQSKTVVKKIQEGIKLDATDHYQLRRALDSIITELNKFCAPFTYFGYQINDKTQLGVWIDLDALRHAEREGHIIQAHNGSWKGLHSNYILDMSDNCITLYKRRTKEVIWSLK